MIVCEWDFDNVRGFFFLNWQQMEQQLHMDLLIFMRSWASWGHSWALLRRSPSIFSPRLDALLMAPALLHAPPWKTRNAPAPLLFSSAFLLTRAWPGVGTWCASVAPPPPPPSLPPPPPSFFFYSGSRWRLVLVLFLFIKDLLDILSPLSV